MRSRRSASSTSDECTKLRRSPRFIRWNKSPQVENASNDKPRVRKKLVPDEEASSKKTKVRGTKKIPKTSVNSVNELVKLANTPRRSPRLSSGVVEGQNTMHLFRSSNLQTGVGDVESTRGHVPCKGTKRVWSKLKEGFENVGADEEVDECKKIGLRSGSSKTRIVCALPVVKEGAYGENKVLMKRIQGEVINTKDEGRSTRCCVLALPTAQKERGDEDKVQRKGTQCEVLNTSSKEWTKEEEAALQRAYLAAKPTPHFWKKVAKLVPGKSAQECFDKIHSGHLTPTQPKTRAKMSRKAASPIEQSPLSASKVLNSPDPMMRKPNRSKPKGHLVHKTVRQLLQRHSIVDENYQADLFSVLEPGIDPFTKAFQSDIIMITPENSNKKRKHLQELRERSSSGHKRPLSRFHSSSGGTLTSPPVLKEIKNRLLHEKYLDQLHSREAKRISTQVGKAFIEGNKAQLDDRRDTIKAAKNALALDLNDAINQLRHLRDDSLSNSTGFDEDCLDRGSEDTDEDIC